MAALFKTGMLAQEKPLAAAAGVQDRLWDSAEAMRCSVHGQVTADLLWKARSRVQPSVSQQARAPGPLSVARRTATSYGSYSDRSGGSTSSSQLACVVGDPLLEVRFCTERKAECMPRRRNAPGRSAAGAKVT